MLRHLAQRAAQAVEPGVPAARSFYSLSLEFTEEVAPSKPKAGAPDLVAQWGAKKAATEEALKVVSTYKDLGDLAQEPYLANHNPRTFEDMDKPIPNFKKFGLKAGEVPRFFDGVLQARASAAVAAKDAWWAQRRESAQEAVKERTFQPFASLPVPAWQLGRPVAMQGLQAATDKLFAQMEPKRKLAAIDAASPAVSSSLASLTKALGAGSGAALAESLKKSLASKAVVMEGGKPLPDFKFMSAADASAKVTARRNELHSRYVKLWAKRVLAMPEQAMVPKNERDALLASKFEDVSDKYNESVDLVARGPETYGKRLAGCAGMDSFFLRRSKEEVEGMFPPTEQEKEAAATAAQLADPSVALSKLLGPTLMPGGSSNRPKSEETEEVTAFKYTPDRYMYAEGMKLAERYRKQEAAGAADGAPKPVVEVSADEAAANAYLQYVLKKQDAFVSDPSNAELEEVLHPQIVKERFDIEMAELDAAEAMMDEAEEEELWALTLQRQARHIHQNIEFDMPQAQYAHMDPILYKKLDWEVTHGLDTLHHEAFQAADCEQGEYIKDQMGLEALSHHMLPLIRYRRAKARAAKGYFAPELTALPVSASPVNELSA